MESKGRVVDGKGKGGGKMELKFSKVRLGSEWTKAKLRNNE